MARKLTIAVVWVVLAALTTAAANPADRGGFDAASAVRSVADAPELSGITVTAATDGFITGTVTVPFGSPTDVCIDAIDFNFNFDGFTTAAANGTYTLGPLEPDQYNVLFAPCDSAELAYEYYPNQPDVLSADLIVVDPGQTVTGINAAMDQGGVLEGTTTFLEVGSANTRPAAEVFAVLTDSQGFPTTAAPSDAAGAWSIGAGRPGLEHAVYFVDVLDRFAFQYSDSAATFGATAKFVAVVGTPTQVPVDPLDVSFAGGWPVPRVGDFTGDGQDDVLAFDGRGNWWVAEADAFDFVFYPWKHFNTETGWFPQLVGDYNGDGADDVVNYHAASGTWWVLGGGATTPTVTLWATFSSKTGWGPQLVGDFNGDGLDDVVNYHEGLGRWWVNVSNGSTFTLKLWSEFSTRTGWGPHLVGDFTGDGRDDVLSYHEGTGRWWLNRSTGTGFTLELWATFGTKSGWSQHHVGDFNGDGKVDFIVFHQGTGRWWVNLSTGTGFTQALWTTFATTTGWTFHGVGEFTNDGKTDLVSYHEGTGRWWVAVSTGSGFTLGHWSTYATKTGWAPMVIGDFNDNGYFDVATYHQGTKAWWVNASTGTGFHLSRWLDIP